MGGRGTNTATQSLPISVISTDPVGWCMVGTPAMKSASKRRSKSELLRFLSSFHQRNECGPTTREIMDHFAWKHRNSAVQMLTQLKRDGFVRISLTTPSRFERIVSIPDGGSVISVPVVSLLPGAKIPSSANEAPPRCFFDNALLRISERSMPLLIKLKGHVSGEIEVGPPAFLLITRRQRSDRLRYLVRVAGKLQIVKCAKKGDYGAFGLHINGRVTFVGEQKVAVLGAVRAVIWPGRPHRMSSQCSC